MSGGIETETVDAKRLPCPKCGTEVWTFDDADFIGLAPTEVEGKEAVHTATLCAVRLELAAARGLLGEVLDRRGGCENMPQCKDMLDENEPMLRAEWCKICDMSARIAVMLGRSE